MLHISRFRLKERLKTGGESSSNVIADADDDDDDDALVLVPELFVPVIQHMRAVMLHGLK